MRLTGGRVRGCHPENLVGYSFKIRGKVCKRWKPPSSSFLGRHHASIINSSSRWGGECFCPVFVFMVLWKNHFRSQYNERPSFWNVTFHKLLCFFKLLFIWLCQVLVEACKVFGCGMWDLFIVPWSGIKSRRPALGAWSLSHWTPRGVPINYCGHVLREHALRIINFLGTWGSCRHMFHYLGPCPVLPLRGFVAMKIRCFFFLAALGLDCCTRTFSSCSEWGYPLVAALWFLTASASLAAEHGL